MKGEVRRAECGVWKKENYKSWKRESLQMTPSFSGRVALALVALAICCLAPGAASAAPKVEQWHPLDLTFATDQNYGNPFMAVTLAATFSGPTGEKLVVPGFYAGGKMWKIRFSPVRQGKWSYVTQSSDVRMNGKTGRLTCIANTNSHVHGRLGVDPAKPYHFKYEDGTPYFLMGFEADWLGLMDFGDPKISTTRGLIDMYAARGFNHVVMNVYAHDTDWCTGKTRPEDYGPPAMCVWPGGNDKPDYGRLNTEFFDHFDRVIDHLYQQGVVVNLFFKVYNKHVNWPAKDSPEEDLYFKYVTQRYQAYPNIVWDFSKESFYEKDKDYIKRRLELIKATDAYGHMTTTHTDSLYCNDPKYKATVSFPTHQNHQYWYLSIVEEHKVNKWPIVNSEYGYEHGPGGMTDCTYGVVQWPEEVLRRTYEVVMAGGYPCYYYTNHAWDVVRVNEEPAGLKYYQYLYRFMTRTKWQDLVPDDSLIYDAIGKHCLARGGKEYVVYFSSGGDLILNINGAPSKLSGRWMNGLTGEEKSSASYGNGLQKITAPWPGEPSLLHLASE